MFDARARRPRPLLDDKILTAWNGLMIAAFARAFRVLRSADHLESARRAASFLKHTMWQGASRTLFRRYREGDVAIEAYAEDYACLVWGLLELFQADGDPAWLEWALELQRRQDELFWDENAGGWFATTGADPSVIVRMKEDYDGAEPSATSVAASNLIVLAHLTGDAVWRARAERTFQGASARITGAGRSVPMMLAALSAWHAGVQQVAIVGASGDPAREALERVAAARYLPFAVVVPVAPGELATASRGGGAVARGDAHRGRPGDSVSLPRLRVPGADGGACGARPAVVGVNVPDRRHAALAGSSQERGCSQHATPAGDVAHRASAAATSWVRG